jgi:hypothetical protein
MFPATKQFFGSWLAYMANTVFLAGVTMFALGVSVSMSMWMSAKITARGGFLVQTGSYFVVVVYWVLTHIFLAILVYQGPNIAAMLVGGSPFQQGGGIVQSAFMVMRFRPGGAGGAGGSGAGTQGGGQVTRPSRLQRFSEGSGRVAADVMRGGQYVYQQVAARARARGR